MVGHAVDQQTRNEADQGKGGGDFEKQAAAKFLLLEAQHQTQHQPNNDTHQQGCGDHIEAKQQLVIALVELAVVGRLGEQEKQHQAERQNNSSADQHQPAHMEFSNWFCRRFDSNSACVGRCLWNHLPVSNTKRWVLFQAMFQSF